MLTWRRHAYLAAAVLVLGAAGLALARKGAAPPAPAASAAGQDQPPNEALRPILRELIQKQMSQHAMAASDTWWNAIDLRFDAARASAQQLIDAPVLSQTAAPDTVNAELPPRFFELQNQMRAAAKDVAAAAAAHDAHALGAATGKLTEGCIACHAELRPRP